jgi:PAS domain S-box-containing protein
MKYKDKTKEKLINELSKLRQRISELEASETERKRAEEALKASEEKFKNIYESVADGLIFLNRTGRIIDINKQALKIYGGPKEKLLGKFFTKVGVFTLKDIPQIVKEFKGILTGDKRTIYIRIKNRKGQEIDLECLGTIIKKDNRPAFVNVIVRDITERKKAEEKIKIYQEKLRSLASRLSLAEEEERRRIARMLHDNIAQKLALAKVKLGALREPLSAPDLVKNIDEIRELIQETIQDTSSLTFELSPPILYELGLVAAVEWLTEQIQDKYNIQIDFEDDEKPKPLGNDIRIVLFQAMRELLINAAKHSQAEMVKVSSHGDGKKIRIRVEDDGVGFKISETQPYFAKTGGFGLFNIQERLEQLGGHLEIESTPGCGTRITLATPLERREKDSRKK